jgi:hypothetical protein
MLFGTGWFRTAVAGFTAAFVSMAPAAEQEFRPQVGQAGKDVIWVPTPDEVVERMLRMAQTSATDIVYDLGSGDGKIVIAAARMFGARATGFEFNPEMVKLSQRNAQAAGVADKTSFRQADIFQSDLSPATVITMYLLPSLNLKLRPQLLKLRPGTRIVSHSFDMDDWKPDEISTVDGRRAHMWYVPAPVAGAWTLTTNDAAGSARFEILLDQRYQMLDGYVRLGRVQAGLRQARLTGATINFTIVDDQGLRRDFTGTVNGAGMDGRYLTDKGQEGRWSARR